MRCRLFDRIGFTGPGQGFVDFNLVPMTHYSRSLQSCPISRWVTNKLHFWPYFSPFLPPLAAFWPKLDLICHFLFHRAVRSHSSHLFLFKSIRTHIWKCRNRVNNSMPKSSKNTRRCPFLPFNVMFPQYKGNGEILKLKRLQQTPIGH